MSAYYNEIDKFAAQWLRELIKAGLIADGEVDERDIRDVQPQDVRGFAQCHFFAGIGGWSYALRLAGWPDNRPVWTGSCPCQPFAPGGWRNGEQDARHLWPVWYPLIRECQPAVVFGEQVAGKAGESWIDTVRLDLEDEDYAVACFDLPAASVGAPHARPRLYFVGHGSWADSNMRVDNGRPCVVQMGRLGNSGAPEEAPHARGDFWANQPRPPIVAYGIPGRVGQVRGYGNAIVPQVAQVFIEAYLDGERGRGSVAMEPATAFRSEAP